MKPALRRLAATAAAAAVTGTALVGATATPASASTVGPIGRCPNNYVCLFSGPDLTGTIIFEMSGSYMHDHPTHNYTSGWLQYGGPNQIYGTGIAPVSAANASLGRFCTFVNWAPYKTNILNPRTSGNLAQHVGYEVGAC